MSNDQPNNYREFRDRMAAMNLVTQGVQGGVNVLAAAFNNRRLADQARQKQALDYALAERRLNLAEEKAKNPKAKTTPIEKGAISYAKLDKIFHDIATAHPEIKDQNILSSMARKQFMQTQFPSILNQLEGSTKDNIQYRGVNNALADLNAVIQQSTPTELQDYGKMNPAILKQAQSTLASIKAIHPGYNYAPIDNFIGKGYEGVAAKELNKHEQNVNKWVLPQVNDKLKSVINDIEFGDTSKKDAYGVPIRRPYTTEEIAIKKAEARKFALGVKQNWFNDQKKAGIDINNPELQQAGNIVDTTIDSTLNGY